MTTDPMALQVAHDIEQAASDDENMTFMPVHELSTPKVYPPRTKGYEPPAYGGAQERAKG